MGVSGAELLLRGGRGPFSGDPEGCLSLTKESAGRSHGMITSDEQARVLSVIGTVKIASKAQIRAMTGLSEKACDRIIRLLFGLGFLDRLVTGRSPPLYAAGPEAEAQYGLKRERWDVLNAFRLAAATQFYAEMSKVFEGIEYVPVPDLSLTALMRLNGREHGVLAPRCWPGETVWFSEAAAGFVEPLHVIVIAGSEELARETARLTAYERIRFTWDAALYGRIQLYRKGVRGILEPAETFCSRGY